MAAAFHVVPYDIKSVAELGLRSDSGPPVRSDAVVLFGITGDLAFKKLFPARRLQL